MKHWHIVGIALLLLLPAGSAPAQDTQTDQPRRERRANDNRPTDAVRGDRAQRGGRNVRREGDAPLRQLTPEQAAEYMPIIRDVMPQIAERLANVQKENPERFASHISSIEPRLRPLLDLKKSDPEAYKTHVDLAQVQILIFRLAQQHRRAEREGNAEQTATLKQQLRGALVRQFELRLKAMEHDMQQLRKRIEQMQQRLRQRAAEREKLIDQELERTLSGDTGGRRGMGPGMRGGRPEGDAGPRGPRGLRDVEGDGPPDRPLRGPFRDRPPADAPAPAEGDTAG